MKKKRECIGRRTIGKTILRALFIFFGQVFLFEADRDTEKSLRFFHISMQIPR
jgi:hypothetical protein